MQMKYHKAVCTSSNQVNMNTATQLTSLCYAYLLQHPLYCTPRPRHSVYTPAKWSQDICLSQLSENVSMHFCSWLICTYRRTRSPSLGKNQNSSALPDADVAGGGQKESSMLHLACWFLQWPVGSYMVIHGSALFNDLGACRITGGLVRVKAKPAHF